jgi:hypothetical protein
MKYEQWLFTQEGYHINLLPFNPSAPKQPGYSPEFNPYEDDVSQQ